MAQNSIQSVRGMGDVLPVGQKQFIYRSENWNWIRNGFSQWAELHGYGYIETPVIEKLDLFKRTSGETSDIVGKEMYIVGRSSGETGEDGLLAMRPEGSAGVCRAVVEHGLARSQAGLKFYYILPMFRSERPQKGRYRQHTQVGVEIFKEASPAADVEAIAMLMGFYDRIGLKDVVMHVNSVGDAECRPRYRDALIQFLEPLKDQMGADAAARLYTNPMRCLDSKNPHDLELFKDAPSILDYLNAECADDFAEVRMGLEKLGIAYEVDPRMVRGLDYYTKTAFEAKCNSLDGAIKTIGAGGRYDGLVEQIGGPPTPGVGFGSSIERILVAIESQKIAAPPAAKPRALVAYMDDGVKYDALAMTEQLRARGVYTEFVYRAKNLGKQLSVAGDLDVDYVIIVGGEEWNRGEVMVKEYKTRQQQTIACGEAVDHVARKLGA